MVMCEKARVLRGNIVKEQNNAIVIACPSSLCRCLQVVSSKDKIIVRFPFRLHNKARQGLHPVKDASP